MLSLPYTKLILPYPHPNLPCLTLTPPLGPSPQIKCEKEEKAEKLRVKKAIEKGNMEGAKIYAQNAIRKKNEQLNYMKLASRLDATVSRLETQAKMQMVSSAGLTVGALGWRCLSYTEGG